MFPNAKGSEQLSLLTSIDPSNQAAGSSTSSWVALANHHNLLAVIQTGAMANGSTVAVAGDVLLIFNEAAPNYATGVFDPRTWRTF